MLGGPAVQAAGAKRQAGGDVVAAAHAAEHAHQLKSARHAQARDLVAGQAADGAALEAHFARIARQGARDQVHGRGLA
ncbi:hypothetical protein D3C75_1306740 [compost metagenome]